jgi:beta-lactamase class A
MTTSYSLSAIVIALLLFVACQAAPVTDPPAAEARPAKPEMDRELQKAIVRIAANSKGRIGVYAEAVESGRWVGSRENERFPMQSVVKVPISMAALALVDKGMLRLDQLVAVGVNDLTVDNQRSPIRDKWPKGTEMTVRDLIREAIVVSDGTAADVLQRISGGAAGVRLYLESIGVKGMHIEWSHKEFGSDWPRQYDNWATPEATAELLRKLWESSRASEAEGKAKTQAISKPSAELLLGFMSASENPDDRILGGLPAGTAVAHKTGTGGTRNGVTSATNDVGIVTLPDGSHILIAVYVADSSADAAQRADVIAKIVRTVFDRWSPQPVKSPESVGFNERYTIN